MSENKEQIDFSWDNISIGQYTQIMAVNDMKCDDTDKCVQWLSILTGEDENHYLNMLLTKLQQEFKKLSFLSTEMKPLEPRFKNGKYIIPRGSIRYKPGSWWYRLQSLFRPRRGREDITLKLTPSSINMTAGQFIDYQNTLISNPEDIAMLCAIVLIPQGCTYNNGYDVLELKQTLYDRFPITDALGISFFFKRCTTSHVQLPYAILGKL